MGSITNATQPPGTIWGEFMHPVITSQTSNGDPWQRKYFAPPSFKPLVSRKYPIRDIRPLIESSEYSALAHLQSEGFGVVKHHSAFLDQLNGGELSQDAITEVYHAEIKQLVRDTIGCKDVFIVGSVFRQGKPVGEAYQLPTQRHDISNAGQHRLAGQSKLQLAAPIRVPHMDFTPLGARQSIRFEQKEMFDVATKAGIIAAEDRIYPDPITKASDAIIAEQYNADGANPRYAAYSIWRPLRKVGRDPLALSPRRKGQALTTADGYVHHFYENRLPGSAELKGDFLKEYTMLGVKEEKVAEKSEELRWYHVSEQEPDEVLFVKLFDSAALGANTEHAPAPWHGSPDIGDAARSDEPRESIDIRIVVFW